MQLIADGRYRRLAHRSKVSYAKAGSCPHAVMDDFLPGEIGEQLLGALPDPNALDWMRFGKHHSQKLATRGDQQLGRFTHKVLRQFNGPACLRFLDTLGGISGLIPDPSFEGGGSHQIGHDGFLKIHADLSVHPKFNLHRRINVIPYLNKDWPEEYKGHMEPWDKSMTHCVCKILPAPLTAAWSSARRIGRIMGTRSGWPAPRE